MMPWQNDALIRESGSFNDVACKLKKPFVCQMFGITRRATITVIGNVHLSGGGIEGGNLDLHGESIIEHYYAHKAAAIFVNPPIIDISSTSDASNYANVLSTLYLEEGSSLTLAANVTSTNFTHVGEIADMANTSSALRMQSYLSIEEGVQWLIPEQELPYYHTGSTTDFVGIRLTSLLMRGATS